MAEFRVVHLNRFYSFQYIISISNTDIQLVVFIYLLYDDNFPF